MPKSIINENSYSILEHPGFKRLGDTMPPIGQPDLKWRVDIANEYGILRFYYGRTPREALEVASKIQEVHQKLFAKPLPPGERVKELPEAHRQAMRRRIKPINTVE